MLFDWFTFVAQIINFLILMWLLKRFLYKPVLKAIDAREQHIDDLLAQTKASQLQAAEQQALLLQKNTDFETNKTAMFAQVKEQAAEQLQLQLDAAQQEIQSTRDQWLKTLQKEQQALTLSVHQRARHEVIELSRRVLRDMSDTALEIQMVKVLIKRIVEMSAEQRTQLTHVAKNPSHSLIVKSAFSLNAAQQKEISQVLISQLPSEPKLAFVQDANLLGGIELLGNDTKISWNITDYLAELDFNIEQLFERKFRS